jgi:alpha-mannosidase
LRRAVSIFNDSENVILTTADARVIRIRNDETTGNYVIISNPVTNFPDNWNRHENLSGKITYRYAFSYAKGSFDPAATSKKGYELNTPLQVRKSWFRPSPSHDEFISIDNQNIILLNLKSTENGFVLRLINADSENSQTAKVTSRFLTSFNAEKIDLLGKSKEKIEIDNDSFQVTLKSAEFVDILINTIK